MTSNNSFGSKKRRKRGGRERGESQELVLSRERRERGRDRERD